MSKQWILPLLAVGMFGFAIFHSVSAKPEYPAQPHRIDPVALQVAGHGVVEPETENISIGAPLPGLVQEVLVRVGDQVYGPTWYSPATPLFRQRTRALQAELQVRKANLAAAEANLAKVLHQPKPDEEPSAIARVEEAKAQFEDQQHQFERAEKLLASAAVSTEEVIRRKQALQMAQAQYNRALADLALLRKSIAHWEFDKEVARTAVEQAKAAVRQTEVDIERKTIRAPVDGVVLQCNIHPGEFVSVPAASPLMVIGNVNRLHVRVDIDENDIPRFRPTMKGYATLRGLTEPKFPLEFVRIEPMMVPKKSLSGSTAERVDVRVLQVIYRIDPGKVPLYVGQQLDVVLQQ